MIEGIQQGFKLQKRCSIVAHYKDVITALPELTYPYLGDTFSTCDFGLGFRVLDMRDHTLPDPVFKA